MVFSPPQAFKYCQQIAREHYENFPVASVFLPKNIRKHIAAVYAFARIADDFADEGSLTPQERLEKLDEWEQQLRACYHGTASHPIFIALRETVSTFHIPREYFERLLIAFRADVTKNRYETWHEVLSYCENSANPVGRIVLHLFGYTDAERCRHSDAICTALQLTNFWQDLSVDIARNRIYIPRDDIKRYGCSEDDILAQRCTPNVHDLLHEMVLRTEQLFEQGRRLTSMVHFPLNCELKLTVLGGYHILTLIRKQNYNTFVKRPTLGAQSVLPLLFRCFFVKL